MLIFMAMAFQASSGATLRHHLQVTLLIRTHQMIVPGEHRLCIIDVRYGVQTGSSIHRVFALEQ